MDPPTMVLVNPRGEEQQMGQVMRAYERCRRWWSEVAARARGEAEAGMTTAEYSVGVS
ncbi:hypothetical protein [Arsenicicoccus dermatophilus]|uniref:hypothetical protein n=1 Tax=Arsenicicoccus dermatophilus TaxID=1076331 RepID=UPI003916D7AD